MNMHQNSSSEPLMNMNDEARQQIESEKKILNNVMSIKLSSDGLVIQEGEDEDEQTRLPGVYCQGIQYYDLKNVQFINATGMAILIDLLKNLLELGVDVQFVNVDEKIKKKVKEMGLEKIINFADR